MRRTLSLKRIVPTHESFFLSNHDKVDCSCRCKISISSSNSLRVSNDGSQIHQLSLIRSESKSLCWKVRHVGSSKHEFDIDGVYDGTNEDEVIHLTIYPEDGCCDDHASAVLPSLPSLHEEKVEWVDLRSNGVVMAKVYLSIDIKDDYYTHNNFTGNVESDLHLTIRLNQVHFHETQSVCGPFFITYEFAGATIKSNECHLNSKEFEPLEDEFHVSINHDEIQSFLEQNKIKMYVYNYGRIFGEVQFDLYSALILDNVDKPCGQFKPDERWKRWIELFSPAVREPSIPRSTNPVMKIQVELIISEGNPPGNDKADQDTKEIFVTQENCSNISDVDFLTKNRSSFSSKSILEQSLMEKANSLARAELELDKRRQKWDEFRIREERKFQDYLMKKEEALRSLLQDQMKEQEIDHMRTIETCRSEYKRLEARLKSALSEVETKEREMDRILAANNTTFIQKVTELELKDKLIQDEAKHTVDMEVSSDMIHKSKKAHRI